MIQKILLITPPLTQLNTPYPATAYLKGFLQTQGFEVRQADLGIELILQLFTPKELRRVFDQVQRQAPSLSPNAQRILQLRKRYEETIGPVIRFLQNRDPTLAHNLCRMGFLPEASRFEALQDLGAAFGDMGITDQARHLATLYLDDLSDFMIEAVSPHFGFSRYAESLALSATSFEPLLTALSQEEGTLERILLQSLADLMGRYPADIIGFSIPFPGNLFGALKCGAWIKQNLPEVPIVWGGGYVSTELRTLKDPRVFDFVDYILLDDGEAPLLRLIQSINTNSSSPLQRTFRRIQGRIQYEEGQEYPDIPHTQTGTPDYSDLPLDQYLSVLEVLNPMHRLWNDGRWNKMTLAHGCYWKRCTFCDITLDYIARYSEAPAVLLVDRMERLIEQTGTTGFHFVDEAASPEILQSLSLEILRRGLIVTWWTNIRFEARFSADLCYLMARAGCIAVSGGIEVASDRLLKMIRKGVSIQQVARVAENFTRAGVLIHAYLMYGFPTQTIQETVDSLEIVRQLFEAEIVQSAYWHRFSMTAHSPIGKDPESFGVTQVGPTPQGFAINDLIHKERAGIAHDAFAFGLKKSLYNYMHHIGFDFPLQSWFDFSIPPTTVPADRIERAIAGTTKPDSQRLSDLVCWIGGEITFLQPPQKKKKKSQKSLGKILLNQNSELISLPCHTSIALWMINHVIKSNFDNNLKTLSDLSISWDSQKNGSFDLFLQSKFWRDLRKRGLLLLHNW